MIHRELFTSTSMSCVHHDLSTSTSMSCVHHDLSTSTSMPCVHQDNLMSCVHHDLSIFMSCVHAGFEQTILETLSIIRGTNLPGLKDRIDKSKPAKEAHNRATKEGGVGTLTQRWNQQHAKMAKQVTDTRKLFHIMASATLTRAVRELAMPVMGGAGFVVVDADREAVDYVNSPEDLHNLGNKSVAADDSEENSTVAKNKGSKKNTKTADSDSKDNDGENEVSDSDGSD